MGYLCRKVKQLGLIIAVVMITSVSAAGCGVKNASGTEYRTQGAEKDVSDIEYGASGAEKENTSGKEPNSSGVEKKDTSGKEPDSTEAVTADASGAGFGSAGAGKADKTGMEKEDAKNTAYHGEKDDADMLSKVPIYGKGQKAEIIKYLSTLPDEMSVKEAKKRGIIIESYYKNPKKFKKEWMEFYKYARAGEKQYSPKYGALTCYSKPYDKCAVTILKYTVEGDACYTYLSFIKGSYYMLIDSSRDSFRDSSWDGIGDLMTYKSLRKYKKSFYDEESKLLWKSTQYYLLKEQDLTRKKVKK